MITLNDIDEIKASLAEIKKEVEEINLKIDKVFEIKSMIEDDGKENPY